MGPGGLPSSLSEGLGLSQSEGPPWSASQCLASSGRAQPLVPSFILSVPALHSHPLGCQALSNVCFSHVLFQECVLWT